MRAKRMSNDLTGTTKPVRSSRAKLERMGREWGFTHGASALPIGNMVHDRACAMAILERTGKMPEWRHETLCELGLI